MNAVDGINSFVRLNKEQESQNEVDLEDFAYQLSPELIAKQPSVVRDQSRLLYYDKRQAALNHLVFRQIDRVLQSGDVLVVNNTKVIPARLIGKRESGGIVELLLVKKEIDNGGIWQALAERLRKLKVGEVIKVAGKKAVHEIAIEGVNIAANGQKRLLIRLGKPDGEDHSFEILHDAGMAPIPPYIVHERKEEPEAASKAQINKDLERYQTIFAKEPGAIAAPTAALHFSPELLADLQKQGIKVCEVTLHVGPGTFKPIAENIDGHIMEPEWFAISIATTDMINAAKREGRRVIAVGTTTCRALESACINGEVVPTEGSYTSMFIKPGYQFKIIDGLVTNFHLSKSSLLLLVAALIGRDELMRAYEAAIDHKYRFYSYGDAMMIL